MRQQDTIFCELLGDGRIKVFCGGISAENHTSADRLFEAIEELAGGEVQRQKVAPQKQSKMKREMLLAIDA